MAHYTPPFTTEELLAGVDAMMKGENINRWINKVKDLTVEQRLQWDADIERRVNEFEQWCKENQTEWKKFIPSD